GREAAQDDGSNDAVGLEHVGAHGESARGGGGAGPGEDGILEGRVAFEGDVADEERGLAQAEFVGGLRVAVWQMESKRGDVDANLARLATVFAEKDVA